MFKLIKHSITVDVSLKIKDTNILRLGVSTTNLVSQTTSTTQTHMGYRNLRACVSDLEKNGHLLRIEHRRRLVGSG